MTRPSPLLTFYGDDFTGSADLVLQYQRFGLQGVIFLGSPSDDELVAAAAKFPVVGIAGVTRALRSEEIAAAIEPAFRALARLSPQLLQYKVCSTADSSPETGSFEPAIRIGRKLCGSRPVPVLVAQPDLGRYTAFSNHFAADRGIVYRLDRQPIMSRHPVTPMTEADLRIHLQRQTGRSVGAVTVTELHAGRGEESYRAAKKTDLEAVVFDSLTEADLRLAGNVILGLADGAPVFAVGSGGLSVGIAASLGFEEGMGSPPLPAIEGPCLAVSGSCSQLTSDQIRHATDHGWLGIPLDLATDPASWRDRLGPVIEDAVQALDNGRSVVVYTCGDDQRMTVTPIDVAILAEALSSVVRDCGARVPLCRAIIAGGDTSGHVVTALGASAMTSTAAVGKYTLLCELSSSDPVVNGLEVVLKGGQIGGVDFFELVRTGTERSNNYTA